MKPRLRRLACRLVGHRAVRTTFLPSPAQAFAYRIDCTRCGHVIRAEPAPWVEQLVRTRLARYASASSRAGAAFIEGLEDADARDAAERRVAFRKWQDSQA